MSRGYKGAPALLCGKCLHCVRRELNEAILRLNRVKAKRGVISRQMAEISERRLKAASEMIHRIDDILSEEDYQEKLTRLKPEIERIKPTKV